MLAHREQGSAGNEREETAEVYGETQIAIGGESQVDSVFQVDRDCEFGDSGDIDELDSNANRREVRREYETWSSAFRDRTEKQRSCALVGQGESRLRLFEDPGNCEKYGVCQRKDNHTRNPRKGRRSSLTGAGNGKSWKTFQKANCNIMERRAASRSNC